MKLFISLIVIVLSLVSGCSNKNQNSMSNHIQTQGDGNANVLEVEHSQIANEDWSISGDTLQIFSDHGMNSWMNDWSNKELLEDISHIELWPGVTAINEHAFAYRDYIVADITIPASVKRIESWALMNIKTVLIDIANPYFTLQNNCLVRREDMAAIYCNLECEIVSVPEGVRAILGAFTDNTSVKTIYIPDTVEIFSEAAFHGCVNLESVVFPKTSSVYFDELSFYNTGIKEMILPDHSYLSGAYADDSGMFGSNLQRLIVTGKDTNIEFKDFRTAKGLKQIVFLCEMPSAMNSDAFRLCDSSLIIYYDAKFSSSWAPNGEAEWNGIPIVGIDSLQELPSI